MTGKVKHGGGALRTEQIADLLPARLPQITLRHGQVLWLLTELGYRDAVNKSTFYEYIKSLRKLGIPFGREKFETARGRRLAEYSYGHVMELAVVLSLRVYHVVPDAVLRGVTRYRSQLHQIYRRAYVQRRSGAGRSTIVKRNDGKPIELRGLFLDLGIKFSGGHLVRFGPPKLVSSTEALALFSESTISDQTFLPMNLSRLSEQVVVLAQLAPTIRSGP
jgi:hypothetical protein